jgi:DNA-directed RNA polymerase specialized sigma24 family protein
VPESDTNPLLQKVDLLIRLTAVSAVDGKPQREQIALLSRAGFQPRDIAELLGTTANSVRVELSRQRHGGASRRTRKRDEP